MAIEDGDMYSGTELTEVNNASSNPKVVTTTENARQGSKGSNRSFPGFGTRRRKVTNGNNETVLESEMYDERFKSTQRGLKSRHAQMIAIGGTMGTGLFVGTGETLARGGPAFITGSFCLMAFLIWCMITLMVETAAYLPTQGCSMNLFGWRYVSHSMGFSMGWLYFYSLGILVPYEITAASLVIDYWKPPVNIAVWITISTSKRFLLAY